MAKTVDLKSIKKVSDMVKQQVYAAKTATSQPSSPKPAPAAPVATSKYDTSSYDNAMAAYEEKMKADAEAAKAKKTAEYDAQAKSAYVAKLQNQRSLNNNLAQAGIRGGATESANLKLVTDYENNRNQIAQGKANALSAIDKDANDLIFQNNQTQMAAKQAYIQQREAEERQIAESKRQEAVQDKRDKAAWDRQVKENKRQEKLTTTDKNKQAFIVTVGRYDTVKKCDDAIKAIKKLKKTDPKRYNALKWRIPYISAQRATVKARKK